MPTCTGRTGRRPESRVALKVLDDDHRGGDQTARLRREFEFAHQLDHPHVVTVYDNGVGWLTMELVDRRDGEHTARPTSRPTDRAGPDRRRAGLHTSLRNRALRCQAVQYPCFARLFTCGADRLRRGVRGRGDGRIGMPRSVEASLPYAAPELLRGRPPSALTDAVRIGVHRRRIDARCSRRSPPRRGWDSSTLISPGRRRASRARFAWVPRTFRLGAAAGRWRRSRRAGTTRAQSSSRTSARALAATQA